MAKLLLFVLLSLSTHAFAAISDEQFLKSAFSGMIPADKRLARTIEIVKLAERFAAERGIQVERIELENSNGQKYPALKMSTEGQSAQNKEAKRIAEKMSDLPLVFSPLDLSFGSEAYFQADGSHLGLPYAFFTDGPKDSSYLHELGHAEVHHLLISGSNPLWGGNVRVNESFLDALFVSSKNTEGYSNAVALEEILTTALSIKLDTPELLKLRANLPKNEFEKHWGPGRELLSSIHFRLELGLALAKQTADVASRALDALTAVQTSTTYLSIGSRKEEVFQSVIRIDAYGYENGFKKKAIPNATLLTLYSNESPTADSLRLRMETIRKKSAEAELHFAAALKTISKGFMHVEVAKSDIDSLAKLAAGPFDVLVEKKP